MKHALLLILVVFSTSVVRAQYKGGPGGSYASASWVKPGTQDVWVEWGANPVAAASGVNYQVGGARNRIQLRAWDATGRLITDKDIFVNVSMLRGVWGAGYAAGIYLVQLDVDGRLFTRKQVLIQQ